jgi:threonine dehydrogenase-like Zn-dependent dehydrogenase
MKLLGDRSIVPSRDVMPLPDGLDPESASLVFQAGVALHGVKTADIALGDYVLVTGQGIIGVFAAQFARLCGARRVIATDLSDKQLAISREVGVDHTLNPARDDVPPRVKELTDGRGADIVLEVSGSPKALEQGTQAAAPLARIAVIGWIMDPLTINPAEDLTPKGLEIIVCHANRRGHHRQQYQRVQEGATKAQLEQENREFIFELMASGRLHAKPLITHRFPLSDLVEAWKFIDEQPAEYMQVVLTR